MEKYKYEGFRPYRYEENKKEQLFVKQINQELEYSKSFLKDISGIENSDEKFLSDREEKIIISIIQWIGSPVGQSFIKKVDTLENENIMKLLKNLKHM